MNKDKNQVDKYTYVAMAGELLRYTRIDAGIDHIFLSDEETAEIVYKDNRRLHKRVNIACDSNLTILKNLIKAIE